MGRPPAQAAVRARLAAELEKLAYEPRRGRPLPNITSVFNLDPFIKAERAWLPVSEQRICIRKRENAVQSQAILKREGIRVKQGT